MNNENHEKLLHLTFRMKIFQYERFLCSPWPKATQSERASEGGRGRERERVREPEWASKTHFIRLCGRKMAGNLLRIIMSFIPIEFTHTFTLFVFGKKV